MQNNFKIYKLQFVLQNEHEKLNISDYLNITVTVLWFWLKNVCSKTGTGQQLNITVIWLSVEYEHTVLSFYKMMLPQLFICSNKITKLVTEVEIVVVNCFVHTGCRAETNNYSHHWIICSLFSQIIVWRWSLRFWRAVIDPNSIQKQAF